VYPGKPVPAGSRQDSFLVGHKRPPALQKKIMGGGGNITGSSILDARGGNLEVVRSNASSAGIGCR
jgi:hypothetical protein